MSDNLTSNDENEPLNPEWVKSVREKVTIARAEIARGEALDGATIVNQLLERFRIAKESHLSAVDEDSKESIWADLTEAMRSTRSGEVFPIDQLWEMVYADETDSIAWATAFIRDRSSSHPKAD